MYPITAALVVESKQLREELMSSLEALAIRGVLELPEVPSDWSGFLDRVDRVRPDVILLEVSRLSEPLEKVVTGIRATSAQPVVFALHTTAEPEAILAAMRAGASEYLHPPVDLPLRSALERLAKSREGGRQNLARGGKAIGFLSAKGGCGATTLACHVALELPHLIEGKVLLADLDLQAGLVGFLLKSKSPYSVADAV